MLSSLILILFASVHAHAQESILDKPISIRALYGREFQQICLALQVPCAIEINADGLPLVDPTYGLELSTANSVSIQNTKATVVLDDVIRRYPKHRWSYAAGVLRVYPRGKISKNSLDAPLGKIDLRDQPLDAIFRTIEEKANLLSARAIMRPGKFPINPNPRHCSLAINEATARQALTMAVVKTGHAAWIVRHEKTFRGPITWIELLDYDLAVQAGDATK